MVGGWAGEWVSTCGVRRGLLLPSISEPSLGRILSSLRPCSTELQTLLRHKSQV